MVFIQHEVMVNLKANAAQFVRVMGQSLESFRAMNKVGKEYTTTGGRVANRFRMMMHGMRGFRMEMLSVMFFGMGMQRMFGGLLNPALQIAGVFELISDVLGIFFLPIAMLLLENLLPILEWFLSMPEEVQLLIGGIVLLGAVIGSILAFVGALVLGLGGLIIAIGPLVGVTASAIGSMGLLGAAGAVLSGVITAVSGVFSTVLLPIIAIVIAVLGVLLIAWLNNKEGIEKAIGDLFDAFSTIFGGIWKVVSGVMELIFAIITMDADAAFNALGKIVSGAIDFIIGVVFKLGPAILNLLFQILVGLGKWVLKIPGFFLSLGGKILGSLASGIVGAYGKIKEAIRGIPIIGPLIAGGLDFVEGIASGVVGAVGGAIGFLRDIVPFANGGLVTKPTLALLGEAGPELVTPLGAGGGASPSINVTVNASTASGVSADDIARAVERVLGDELRRLNIR